MPGTRTSRTQILYFASALALAAASLVSACSDDDPTTGSTTPDGGTDGRAKDSGTGDDDDSDDKDASTDAATGKDANGPGEAGTECAFNRDCQAALRCECTKEDGCFCQPGARGTGRNGLDPCTSGNDCASSVCVDGPPGSGTFCSDECTSASDCTGQLPRCIPAGLPELICARAIP